MITEKMLIIAALTIALFWCFRLTECEMHRIDANKSVGIKSCQAMDPGCREENVK